MPHQNYGTQNHSQDDYRRTGKYHQVSRDSLINHTISLLQEYDNMTPRQRRSVRNPYNETVVVKLPKVKKVIEVPNDIQAIAIQMWRESGQYGGDCQGDISRGSASGHTRLGRKKRYGTSDPYFSERRGKEYSRGNLPRDMEIMMASVSNPRRIKMVDNMRGDQDDAGCDCGDCQQGGCSDGSCGINMDKIYDGTIQPQDHMHDGMHYHENQRNFRKVLHPPASHQMYHEMRNNMDNVTGASPDIKTDTAGTEIAGGEEYAPVGEESEYPEEIEGEGYPGEYPEEYAEEYPYEMEEEEMDMETEEMEEEEEGANDPETQGAVGNSTFQILLYAAILALIIVIVQNQLQARK